MLLGDLKQIPHPFIEQTILLVESFENESSNNAQFWFIHLNHSNPVLNNESKENRFVKEKGFFVCKQNQIFKLKK